MSDVSRRCVILAVGALCLVLTVSAAPQGGGGWGEYPASQADAARFLGYSTWGPNAALINELQQVGYERFLEDQFAAPASSYPTLPLYPNTIPADCTGNCVRDNYTMYPLQNLFFTNALYGRDQLRQRVAFALHQILVVSGLEVTHPSRMAPYLQVLDRNAFGNYRQLLYEITLNPAMGVYLDMAGNTGANPNENYAREVLQLFSIGLTVLQEDGRPVLDQSGQPVPTFDQNIINAFSRVFTGWNLVLPVGGIQNYIDPMVPRQAHNTTEKILLGGARLPAGQSAVVDLNAGLDNIFNHPNVGPFIGRQLIQHLVTSNPSPAYVQRVARVFANNGSGVRGDMKAVIRAILLDEEAAADPPPEAGKGHLQHPALFATSLLRAFNARSANGQGLSDGYINPQTMNMGMDIFRPPSVFSYFSPATVVSGSSLRGPEFGILNTSTSVRRTNFVNTIVFGTIAVGANSPTGTSLDFSAIQALANNPQQMVLTLNTLMMSGHMTQPMVDAIVLAVNQVPATNPLGRARTAVYLVATSSQYQVQR